MFCILLFERYWPNPISKCEPYPSFFSELNRVTRGVDELSPCVTYMTRHFTCYCGNPCIITMPFIVIFMGIGKRGCLLFAHNFTLLIQPSNKTEHMLTLAAFHGITSTKLCSYPSSTDIRGVVPSAT